VYISTLYVCTVSCIILILIILILILILLLIIVVTVTKSYSVYIKYFSKQGEKIMIAVLVVSS
jgi:hypothetical protein